MAIIAEILGTSCGRLAQTRPLGQFTSANICILHSFGVFPFFDK
jgi:hypothetical protein